MNDKNMPVRIYGEQEKATYTEHCNLKKPDQEDFYNVQVHNDNMQKIDDTFSGLAKSDVGLGNVDNTSDANKHVKWENIDEKPQTFTPATHNHDTAYFTRKEIMNELFPVKSTRIWYSKDGSGTQFTMPFGEWRMLFARDENVVGNTFILEYWIREK